MNSLITSLVQIECCFSLYCVTKCIITTFLFSNRKIDKRRNVIETYLMSPSVTDSGKAGHLTVSCWESDVKILKYRSVRQHTDLGELNQIPVLSHNLQLVFFTPYLERTSSFDFNLYVQRALAP